MVDDHNKIILAYTGSSSPALLKLLAEDQIPNGRALVPGCGRGYDVITLASATRKAVGTHAIDR